MGSGRWMAQAIQEKYSLDEDTAWERVSVLEGLAVGDDLADAVWGVYDEESGKTFAQAMAEIKAVYTRLGERIAEVEALPWPPREKNER